MLQLLEEVKRRSGPAGNRAAYELAALGPGVLPPLLEAIRTGPRQDRHKLCRVISRLRGEEAIPALISLLKDASLMVQFAAIEGLQRARDPRALHPLLEQLLRWDNSDYTRECVAAALGELRRPEAIPALLEVAEEVLWDPHDPGAVHRLVAREREKVPDDWQAEAGGRLTLLVAVVVALAKLGRQELSPVVIDLMGFHFPEEEDAYDARRVREEAIAASIYVVGPGLLPALRAARRREPFGEDVVDFSLLKALFYLGLRESVDEFIACFEEGYPVGHAWRIEGLVGETVPGELEALKAWWQERRRRFEPHVCYRWGEPIDVSRMVERLPGTLPIQTTMLLEELQVITGEDFEHDRTLPSELYEQDVQDRIDRARTWVRENGHRFEAGCLYKYGHRQDIGVVF